MKLKITEIEATADELKAANSFADALSNQLRNIFNSISTYQYQNTDFNDEEDDEEDD